MEIDYNDKIIGKYLGDGEYLYIYSNTAYVVCYTPKILKSGKPSTKTFDISYRELTRIYKCGCCGALKVPRKIRYIGYQWYSDKAFKRGCDKYKDYDSKKHDVCIGCWNKLKRLYYQEKNNIELVKTIKELKSTVYQKRKEQK